MLLRDTLLSVLRESHPSVPAPPEVERSLTKTLPARSSQAIVLTGVRRSGKSTLLGQLLRRKAGFGFVNFEDTRLFGLGPSDFPTLISALDELSPTPAPIGLDEVQEVDGWQKLVRALLDRGRAVYLTGSNASLLGREMGARLTGRHLSYEVLPFDFREYLDFTGREADGGSLRAYLDDGGFPTWLRERNPEVLRSLLRDVILRDIASRHGVREIRHLMNLALFLLANTGQPFSLQRLAKTLEIPTVSQASRYVEYLEDAYLLLGVPKHATSFRKRVVAPRKYYAVDTGLRRANSPQGSPDVGHRFENAVYLALRARGGPIAYAGERDLWECDFVTDDAAIQVCAQLTPANQARELMGLVSAARLPGKRRPVVLTLDQEDRLTSEGVAVSVQPAWKWFLGRT